MNVHHVRWLYHSKGISPEGRALHELSLKYNLKQLVREPTRFNPDHLLDLVLTDMPNSISVKVSPKIRDHAAIITTLKHSVPKTSTHYREYFVFKEAN